MAISFTKAAIMHSVSGLVGTLIRFGLISATLSLALYFIAWAPMTVQAHTNSTPFFATADTQLFPIPPDVDYVPPPMPENVTIWQYFELFDPSAYLTQYPLFKYLDYIQILWYALLLPVFLGGAVYAIILSQGSGLQQEQVVNYYSDIAWPTLAKVGIILLIWLLAGGATLTGFSALPSNFMTEGLLGLIHLGISSAWDRLMSVFVVIYPYLPIPVELGAFIYLLKEVHAGWVGNQW